LHTVFISDSFTIQHKHQLVVIMYATYTNSRETKLDTIY